MESKWFFNEDCVAGCAKHVPDNLVDLIITDPPYGIEGDTLHKHYNRKEEFVLDGYIEIPRREYPSFSLAWIKQAERILRPGGSLYIVSGYTNLRHILNALADTTLEEVNHIVWKYNFGVFTKNKYVSSHYHILYYVKPGGRVTFNTFCRFGPDERVKNNRSLNYMDREDVWIINREYKPGQRKNKNQLPTELLTKLIQYSTNEGDLVFDLFLGSFSTAKVAVGMNRRAGGFEMSKLAFSFQMEEMKKLKPGALSQELRVPVLNGFQNQGKAWTHNEMEKVYRRYLTLIGVHRTKKRAVEILCEEFGRGRFSIGKLVERFEREKGEWGRGKKDKQLSLF